MNNIGGIMKHSFFKYVLITLFFPVALILAQQGDQIIGARAGLSIGSAGGSSSAGFQLGGCYEYFLNKNASIGSELNLNTQDGTPIEWGNSYKYYFKVPAHNLKAYIDGGFNLWFMTGGPYFGFRFGGGALFPIDKKLYVPVDIKMGPIFISGSNVFYFAITSGIRYEL